jgi:hypothetical protein
MTTELSTTVNRVKTLRDTDDVFSGSDVKCDWKKRKIFYLQSAQKCGSKFFDWSRKMTLFYRDLFYAWQRRYLN